MCTLITAALALLLTASAAHAACDDRPARKRILVSWNGREDLPIFRSSVNTFHERLSPSADRHFVLRGTNGARRNAWEPPQGNTAETPVFDADSQGLARVATDVAARVQQLVRRDSIDVSDVEIVFFTTNHGSMRVGRNGNEYGLAEMPGAASAPWKSELTAFGRALPRGVRFKSIFGQCFGADTEKTLLDAVGSDDACKCGAAQADEGYPALGPRGATTSWEAVVAGHLGGGSSLQASAWSAAVEGHSGIEGTIGNQQGKNVGLTTSQRFLLSTLRQRLHLRASSSAIDIEAQAERLLEQARGPTPVPRLPAPATIIQATRDARAALLARLPTPTPTPTPGPFGSLGTALAPRLTPEQRLRAQGMLEEAFLRIGGSADLTRYAAMLRCERGPVTPGRGNTGSAATGSSDTSHHPR